MENINTKILSVEEGSLAELAGISAGDRILAINGEEIHDVLEYRFLCAEYEVELLVEHPDGSKEDIIIENEFEDLGIEFENGLLSDARSCRNKCIFCFIDQLPKGMRETVYFKDDDTRLSFLQGNYVTLTNVSDEEIERFIKLRISPINISVHTTNPELREKMLSNRFAGRIYEIMKKLAENEIYMNTQIVLCPDYNDGSELDRTISELAALSPYVMSLSVVPVGLTAHREGLCKLRAFDSEMAEAVISQVEGWQEKLSNTINTRFVYAADEFYIMAGREIPKAEAYEGFPQIENGVGLIASMQEEFDEGIAYVRKNGKKRRVALVTGELAAPFIKSLAKRVENASDGFSAKVFAIKNEFFGGGVNVSGLVTAGDIINQVGDLSEFDELLIPDSMLRDGEDIFLDNITLTELEDRLKIKITPVINDGYCFIEALLGEELELLGEDFDV